MPVADDEEGRTQRLQVRRTRTPERTAQEAADAYERSRTGGSFSCAARAAPLVLEGESVAVTVSIGVGSFDADGHADGEALLRDVDAALYRAKRDGRNRVMPASAC